MIIESGALIKIRRPIDSESVEVVIKSVSVDINSFDDNALRTIVVLDDVYGYVVEVDLLELFFWMRLAEVTG